MLALTASFVFHETRRMNYQPLDVETLDYVVAVKQELKLDAELGPILVRLVDLKVSCSNDKEPRCCKRFVL